MLLDRCNAIDLGSHRSFGSRANNARLVVTFLLLIWQSQSIHLRAGEELVVQNLVSNSPIGDDKPIIFENEVRPIFKAMCFQCHGEEEKLQAGLDVRLMSSLAKGGESGSAFIATRPLESLLWQRIENDEMPEGPKKLSPTQKQIVYRWIEQGAVAKHPANDLTVDPRYTDEELAFWSFQPVKPFPLVSTSIEKSGSSEESTSSEKPPRSERGNSTTAERTYHGEIDVLVRKKLAEQGLAPNLPAERSVLLRRITYDLTGLPPTPDEFREFLADGSEAAYEKAVDRLLSTNQFGVRWARHWLDVAGYAESDGVQGKDPARPHAWRYRDYVVDSFNKDKPYSEFIIEQLAGDELIEGNPNPESARELELLTATGFLRMSPDATSENDTLLERNQAVAESIKVVGSAVMGLTIGCAQCHDHRYDPISTEDYYRFRAIFDPAFPIHHWKKPADRLVDMTPPQVVAARAACEKEALEKEAAIKAMKLARGEEIYREKIAAIDEETRNRIVASLDTAEPMRSEEQKALLEAYPMIKKPQTIADLIVIYDAKMHETSKAAQKAVDEFRAAAPQQVLVMSSNDLASAEVTSHVFYRGDPGSPKKSVSPGEIFVLARNLPPQDLGVSSSIPLTKRRLEYAKILTSGSHPLTARVAVNRIWMHLMGSGIVATPGDFGTFGTRPTNIELLDYLATSFVDNGWSTKQLIRKIVLSETYKQSSKRSSDGEKIDPLNHYYSRANLRRLDAESIRDSLFVAAGDIKLDIGGPSVPVSEDEEGRAVIGKLKINDGLFAGIEPVPDQDKRRSLFIEVKRSLPYNMLDTFDQPMMTPNCEQRKSSTVAPQSLWFLNDNLVLSVAENLAKRICSRHPQSDLEMIDEIYVRIFAYSPTDSEKTACLEFLQKQIELLRTNANPEWQATLTKSPDAARSQSVASLSQVLFSSNRFLYIE